MNSKICYRARTDPKDGTIASHYEYDPFGTLTRRTGTPNNRFQYRFSTKPRDTISGLYYYGYRWYAPLTGRWPSRDPIQEKGGVNFYGFVGNDGVNILDIVGLCYKKVFFIGRTQIMPSFKDNVLSEIYNKMKQRAAMAGFEVVEGASESVVRDAWKSRDYKHIIYYNHGNEEGDLSYETRIGGVGWMTPQFIFDWRVGHADHLTLCCCHSDKVVSLNMIYSFYTYAQVTFDRIVPPYEGDVWQPHHYESLSKYFDKLIERSGEDYMYNSSCEK